MDLDQQRFPSVFNGGVVRPSEAAVGEYPSMGMETQNGDERQRGSSTGSRKGAAGWQRTAGGAWKAGTPSPLLRRSSAQAYEGDLNALKAAYPTSRVWTQKEGIWLLAHSKVIPDLEREAVFVVAIPFDLQALPQAWGFWTTGCIAFARWIGPRHTNFPFGSICAFDPRDGAWRTGDSPIALLDLYTVWAARQLHLEYLGHWPGSQVARWAYERRLECQPMELCGCGSLNRTYARCCLERDQKGLSLANAMLYLRDTGGGERAPPLDILEFLRSQRSPPPITNYT